VATTLRIHVHDPDGNEFVRGRHQLQQGSGVTTLEPRPFQRTPS